MRTFLLLLFLYYGYTVQAQNRCATIDYLQTSRFAYKSADRTVTNTQTIRKIQASQKNIGEMDIIHIPTVVHLLYNNPSQNISDAQIISGIEALNRDFRRKAADTVNTPQRFKGLADDVQIEFGLATTDPSGRKTTGIVRKPTSRIGWATDDKMKRASQDGDDGWDSKSYLNIWVVNLIGSSGYASMPGSAADVDGVVINFNSFGTINTVAPFNMGRTAVHEVGHWLGLKHIWGDAQCGDDGVDDTPQQGFFTKGCPSGFRSSCNNGESGDMYMNFMDYTDDACMNLFTKGQRNRMRSLFIEGGARAALLQSKGLSEPWANEVPLPSGDASLYPNPALEKITVRVNNSLIGKKLSLFNSQGQLQKSLVIDSSQQSISVADLKPGVYILKGEGFVQKFIKL